MANNAAEGNRILILNAKREETKRKQQRDRDSIHEANKVRVSNIDAQFTSKTDNVDDLLVQNTVGLVSAKEFSKRKKHLEAIVEEKRVRLEEELTIKQGKKKKKRKKADKNKLSFLGGDEDEELIAEPAEDDTPRRVGKNPDVDTTFLPDRDRAMEEARQKTELKMEWIKDQEKMKSTKMEVTYSYWDGHGHRKSCEITQGASIATFLREVQKEFKELGGQSVDNIMYIKEDLIIPHTFTFYDLIATKARGKSGPLFHFDVHDDVREVNDWRVEKDESHAGKVVERRWFERNKHIFPASRWEVFDPKTDYGDYSIHGAEVRGPGVIGADL